MPRTHGVTEGDVLYDGLPLTGQADFRRLDGALLMRVRQLPGAATTCSDLLDERGLQLAVPADTIAPRVTAGVVAGHVLTVAYLPERRSLGSSSLRERPRGLQHERIFAMAADGDVIAMDARGAESISLLGGLAAAAARRRGIVGCIVDGGVRDLDEIRESGLCVWSRSVTPRTGRWRLEASTINHPISCGGVQVHPGDIAVADETGVCFIPNRLAEEVLRRLLKVSARERRDRGS